MKEGSEDGGGGGRGRCSLDGKVWRKGMSKVRVGNRNNITEACRQNRSHNVQLEHEELLH